MKRIPPAIRMSLGLASLVISSLCLAHLLGLLPDSTEATLKGRKALCESMAIHCSVAAQRNDIQGIRVTTQAIVERNPDLLSAAVRRANGEMIVEIGDHQSHWTQKGPTSTPTQVHVPVFMNDQPWGNVELRFTEVTATGIWAIFKDPVLRLVSFVSATCFLAYCVYLRFLLKKARLLPTAGIPDRVRTTLDALVEGVLLLDGDQRIALANKAFAGAVGQSPRELEGRTVQEFAWTKPQSAETATEYPWQKAVADAEPQMGTLLGLQTGATGTRTFSVNATPIVSDDGVCRGALATFNDLTLVQKKNEHLKRLLDKLKHSREAIKHQNDQLKDLARLDPLTGCLNRRSFFEEVQVHWGASSRYGHPFSCIILDIDHFKVVNDTNGHTVGDQALQHVAGVLMGCLRSSDVLCRYGGEEFCVVLPHVDLEGAAQAAERFRRQIEQSQFGNLSVTASFGVSTLTPQTRDFPQLLDQADKALYAAKNNGRNCVVRWDKLPSETQVAKPDKFRSEKKPVSESEVAIPFHAVTSLISALAFRDAPTAEHSRRVADLCVATAHGLMSESDCYVLEMAALLHDIGKLGVPDSILRKPGPLTDQEWTVMGAHDRMGEEIITSAFASSTLSKIVRMHHAWHTGNPRHPSLPTGADIPLSARILAIADAYDAMVTERVYRSSRSREEAFLELRRCAGKQFDPDLVERFIEVMLARDESRQSAFPSLSKRGAFKIGIQIEKLATALDTQDMEDLAVMAAQLKGTASEHRLPQIFEVAAQLERAVTANADWLNIIEYSTDLLELCRSTQSSYLVTCSKEDAALAV